MFGGGVATIVIWHADSDYILAMLMPAIAPIMVLLPVCWFYLRRRIPFTSVKETPLPLLLQMDYPDNTKRKKIATQKRILNFGRIRFF